MNGEDFRRDVSNSLTKLVTLQEENNSKLDKLCEGASKDDHQRVEEKVEKIWERVLVMGIVLGGIAAAVGVVGWVS